MTSAERRDTGIGGKHDNFIATTGAARRMHWRHRFGAVIVAVALPLIGYGASSASPQPSRADSPQEAAMTIPRAAHAATVLEDGRVLVTGGMTTNEVVVDTAELYLPALNAFVPTGKMTQPRSAHQTVALPDGRVLVLGGWGGGDLSTTEMYDPLTQLFLPGPDMTVARVSFSATTLRDGRILIVGGARENDEAEIYDPETGTFERTGSLRTARASHTATLLPNGDVLIAGGRGARGVVLAGTEIYDVETGRFHRAGHMIEARQKHGAALLDNGRVLIVGGSGDEGWGGRKSAAELYNPRTGAFLRLPSMADTRFKLPDPINLPGRRAAFVYGGSEISEVYKERSKSFRALPPIFGDARFRPTTSLLPQDIVLIAGGYNEAIVPTNRAFLFSP